jgi:photosystem II stability/assembly factor-like uncharacterized protein
VIIDPEDHNHLYVATRNGQIYQSFDAGLKWIPTSFRLSFTTALQAFVVNPSQPSELYVGVAQESAASPNSRETGIFKSIDRGTHWTLLESTRGWSVHSLSIHPTQPGLIVAGTEEGVFKSDNGGTDWRQISPVGHPELKAIVSLAIDARNPKVIYAGTPHLPWKTVDGGEHWQAIHTGFADDSDIFAIMIDRTNPRHLVVGACSGIYFSNSSGARWARGKGIPESDVRTYRITQHPADEKIVYAGGAHGLWKSSDGGLNWKKANDDSNVVDSVVIDPEDPEVLYLATERRGILKSVDGGTTLEEINEGFVNRNLTAFSREGELYLSSSYEGEFGGVFTTTDDRGLKWALQANQQALHGKNVTSIAVDPANPDQLLAGTFDGLLLSVDGGHSWDIVDVPMGRVHDVAFSPAGLKVLYAATDNGLFDSDDGGLSWQRNEAEELGAAVYKVSLDPRDSRYLVVQTSTGLWISPDHGDSWRLMNVVTDGHVVYDFLFSPDKPNRIFAATSRGLLQSDNEGLDWSPVRGLPISAAGQIVSSPGKSDEMYALFPQGRQVWRSTDGGADWVAISTHGLEDFSLLKLGISPGGQVFVITANQGVFRFMEESNLRQLAVAP